MTNHVLVPANGELLTQQLSMKDLSGMLADMQEKRNDSVRKLHQELVSHATEFINKISDSVKNGSQSVKTAIASFFRQTQNETAEEVAFASENQYSPPKPTYGKR